MKKRVLKLFAGVLFAVMILPGVGILQTRAETFTRVGSLLYSSNGTTYYPNSMGGAKAYVPIDFAKDGANARAVANAMLSLPGMRDGSGGSANTAAFRYQGFNSFTSRGAGAQYLVKTAAARRQAGASPKWLNPPISAGDGRKITFRYAGMVITEAGSTDQSNVKAFAGTNPFFVGDIIQESSKNGTVPITAKVYTQTRSTEDGNLRDTESTQTVYSMGDGVEIIEHLYPNGMYNTACWKGSGNVKTNAATDVNKNLSSAKKAFTLWAKGDEFGAEYKAEAERYIARTGSSQEWWEVLNQYFQITGDPEVTDPVLYFYMVRNTAHNYYSTYTLSGKNSRNTSPTLLAIKDEETGEILTESYRVVDDVTSEEGAVTVVQGSIAKLVPGHHYTVESIMTYYTSNPSTTASTRGIQFYARNTGTEASPINLDTSTMTAYNTLPDASVIVHKSSVDGKNTGSVTTSKMNQATNQIEIQDEYYYQGAAFAAMSFSIPENLQDMQTGYLVVAVPQKATVNGDNECTTDDTLEVQYIITNDTPDPTPTPQSDAFGDMNLGMPEYRQLHYITEEEESDDDDGDEEGDSEPEMIDYEVWSDYGYYQTEDQASLVDKKENSTPKSPDNKHIWEANSVSDAKYTPWWDYTNREWPDQVADIENKCWLTDANGAWNKTGEFLRSFSGENIFGFGFRVSRSRGKKNSILNAAKVNVQIYGVSPDTGEDGILLKEYTDSTHDYKEIKTGSIGVYQYSDAFLQNVVSSKAVNTIEDFPRIRVKARISDDHGESGIFTSYKKEPQQNSWEEEHDTVDRTFACEMDDMRIMEVELKDSEGIVVYHADRYDSDEMQEIVSGYYDREEDLYMKVVVEQNIESGHSVKDPAIDVYITGTNEEGMTEKTYINTTYTLEGVEMGQGVRVTYDDIAFRPRAAEKLDISVQINEKHGEDQWRENIWIDEDDAFSKTLEGTTADLALSQDIVAYNSKNNQQGYLTFAEYLSFKFNIRHIGNGDRQTAIVGGSEINPFAKVNVKIFNQIVFNLYDTVVDATDD